MATITNAPAPENKEDQMTRRDALRQTTAGVLALLAFGSSASAASKDQAPAKNTLATDAEKALSDYRANYFQGQSQAFNRDREAFMKRTDVPARVKEALNDPQVGKALDEARVMPHTTPRDGTPTLNLQEIEKKYGTDTRANVAAVLQWSLNKANEKMGAEIKAMKRDYDVRPSQIEPDGDFGKRSHEARKLFHHRLSTHHELAIGPKMAQPLVMSAHDTGLGSQGFAALEHFNPDLTLFTQNSMALPYAVIRNSADVRASYRKITLDEYKPLPEGSDKLMTTYLAAGLTPTDRAVALAKGTPADRQATLRGVAAPSGTLDSEGMTDLIGRHYNLVSEIQRFTTGASR